MDSPVTSNFSRFTHLAKILLTPEKRVKIAMNFISLYAILTEKGLGTASDLNRLQVEATLAGDYQKAFVAQIRTSVEWYSLDRKPNTFVGQRIGDRRVGRGKCVAGEVEITEFNRSAILSTIRLSWEQSYDSCNRFVHIDTRADVRPQRQRLPQNRIPSQVIPSTADSSTRTAQIICCQITEYFDHQFIDQFIEVIDWISLFQPSIHHRSDGGMRWTRDHFSESCQCDRIKTVHKKWFQTYFCRRSAAERKYGKALEYNIQDLRQSKATASLSASPIASSSATTWFHSVPVDPQALPLMRLWQLSWYHFEKSIRRNGRNTLDFIDFLFL